MCVQSDQDNHSSRTAKAPQDDFPWHLGAFDAHCHPTDTMASLPSIPAMKARALTIMATRSQDQHLVSQAVTDTQSSNLEPASLTQPGSCVVVPSFGWHPWFSHQLYDDLSPSNSGDNVKNGADGKGNLDSFEAKKAHYQAVLTPIPEDDDFINSLPDPLPISSFLASTRTNLLSHPHSLVGEIGIDKAFRLPRQWSPSDESSRDEGLTPGGREGRTLSPYRVQLEHQQVILQHQLRLAGEVGRPVSVHGVQAHGVLFHTIEACWKGYEKEVVSKRQQKRVAIGAEDFDSDSEDDERKKSQVGGKPFPPRICLHSFSAGVEVLHQWLDKSIPAEVYFSFSLAVNTSIKSTQNKLADVVKGVPDNRILMESDLHTAGEDMDEALEGMYRLVCEIKGWGLEEGVRRIGENYRAFVFGQKR